MKRKIRVLSIDGGGIRGIIPAKILVKVEELLQQYSSDSNARLSDYFDLIAGTSTGSILAGLYLCPKEKGSLEAKYSAKEILDMYFKFGEDVFKRSWKTRFIDYFGISNPLYTATNLEKLLEEYFGDMKLDELLKPCLIPSYDINTGKAVFFNQMAACRTSKQNFYVKDVIRASTAAPTYFPVANIMSEQGESYALIDGGVIANNPALCAYIEACKFPSKPDFDDIMIFSVGTGAKDKIYSSESAEHWGKLGWVVPLIDIYGSGGSQTVDHQLEILYQGQDCNKAQNHYYRIEPNLNQFDVSSRMDDARPQNMKALETVADQIIEEELDQIKKFTLTLYQSQRRDKMNKKNFYR